MTDITEPDFVRQPAPVLRLMEEARRRYESFAVRDNKPLGSAWLGLGMPSEYRPAVDRGLMVPLRGSMQPRILHWFLLTERGVELYRQLFPGSEDLTNRKYRDGLEIKA